VHDKGVSDVSRSEQFVVAKIGERNNYACLCSFGVFAFQQIVDLFVELPDVDGVHFIASNRRESVMPVAVGVILHGVGPSVFLEADLAVAAALSTAAMLTHLTVPVGSRPTLLAHLPFLMRHSSWILLTKWNVNQRG
jgi:hypothetical protein